MHDRSVLGQHQENADLVRYAHECGILFKSSALHELLTYLSKIAPTGLPVLIEGETGVGKNLLAKFIHLISQRPGPLVKISCGALPETMIESELFGHERGAFTGAVQVKKGLFEHAEGGTVFLDEINSLPVPLQVKLLNILDDSSLRKVGGVIEKTVDIRVIGASNQDLAQLVEHNAFREDLYFRMKGSQVRIPPLRERKEDILPIAEYILSSHNGRSEYLLTREVKGMLICHDWPGNVRELKYAILQAMAHAENGVITPEHMAHIESRVDLPQLHETHLEVRQWECRNESESHSVYNDSVYEMEKIEEKVHSIYLNIKKEMQELAELLSQNIQRLHWISQLRNYGTSVDKDEMERYIENILSKIIQHIDAHRKTTDSHIQQNHPKGAVVESNLGKKLDKILELLKEDNRGEKGKSEQSTQLAKDTEQRTMGETLEDCCLTIATLALKSDLSLATAKDLLERTIIKESIRKNGTNMAAAARDLGIAPTGFYQKLKRLKIPYRTRRNSSQI